MHTTIEPSDFRSARRLTSRRICFEPPGDRGKPGRQRVTTGFPVGGSGDRPPSRRQSLEEASDVVDELLAAGLPVTSAFHANSRRDRIRLLSIGTTRSAPPRVSAVEHGRTATPSPSEARWTTIGSALASIAISGSKPASAQAASRAVRTPVPRGRLTNG